MSNYSLITLCIWLPPAIETPNPDPDAPCPVCRGWATGPFGLANMLLHNYINSLLIL